jgi:TM2 domain-containing membrane protein YozV
MNCSNHPDREHVAFCQNCGKPLCQECTRVVGAAVYCEPCLAARLAAEQTPFGQAVPGQPNPAIATVLGLIPGVGAMYNGQYAKGVVHLIVFAVLVSLTDSNKIFLLFVFGWMIYQAIEANHTATARLNGTPLPNPFGLNDLGERMGFGKAWPTPPPPANPAAGAPSNPVNPTPPPPPTNTYVPPAASYAAYTQAPASNWGAPNESYNTMPPTAPPYTQPYPGFEPEMAAANRNRFPMGAMWLIGLGVIFLLGNVGFFHFMPVRHLFPFLLIGFGTWLFVHKMTESGVSLTDDGSPDYMWRCFRALRGSGWIILIGVLSLLDSFHILRWKNSWPFFLIGAGVMAIFRRAAYAGMPEPLYPPTTPPPPPATPTSTTTTDIVPFNHHDQEGN